MIAYMSTSGFKGHLASALIRLFRVRQLNSIAIKYGCKCNS